MSCQSNIDPKWIFAIEKNMCPGCGNALMEEHLKNCLTRLAAAMKDMLKYPEQLDDWLLSNHNYIKTSSPDLVNYLSKEAAKQVYNLIEPSTRPEKKGPSPDEPQITTQKIKVPDGNGGFTIEEVQVEKIQSEERTNSFFERAEVLKGAGKTSGKAVKSPDEPGAPKSVEEKTRHLKSLAQQIRREVSSGATSQNSLDAMIDQADPEAIAEFQSVIGSGDIVASGLPDPSNGDDDEIPSVALAMARMSKSNDGNANHKDMQTLQDMQDRVARTQKKLGTGGFGRVGS